MLLVLETEKKMAIERLTKLLTKETQVGVAKELKLTRSMPVRSRWKTSLGFEKFLKSKRGTQIIDSLTKGRITTNDYTVLHNAFINQSIII